jgi:hypothetical protein
MHACRKDLGFPFCHPGPVSIIHPTASFRDVFLTFPISNDPGSAAIRHIMLSNNRRVKWLSARSSQSYWACLTNRPPVFLSEKCTPSEVRSRIQAYRPLRAHSRPSKTTPGSTTGSPALSSGRPRPAKSLVKPGTIKRLRRPETRQAIFSSEIPAGTEARGASWQAPRPYPP